MNVIKFGLFKSVKKTFAFPILSHTMSFWVEMNYQNFTLLVSKVKQGWKDR